MSHFYGDSKNINEQTKQNESTFIDTQNKGVGSREESVRGCVKQMSTINWDCHLPLQGLNHVLWQLLIFNAPWKELRVESRNEALCSPFDIFWSRFVSLILLSPHIYKSSKILHGNSHSSDKQKLSERKYVHDCMYPVFTKITNIPIFTLSSNFSELSEVLSPGLQSSFCPK